MAELFSCLNLISKGFTMSAEEPKNLPGGRPPVSTCQIYGWRTDGQEHGPGGKNPSSKKKPAVRKPRPTQEPLRGAERSLFF